MSKLFWFVSGQAVLVVYGSALVGVHDADAGQERTSSVIDSKSVQSRNVFPLVNRGGDPETDWIGVGIADTISARIDAKRDGRDGRTNPDERYPVG